MRDFLSAFQEDDMAFGRPTKYWKLDINKVDGGTEAYDEAIQKASDVYVSRMVSSQVFYFWGVEQICIYTASFQCHLRLLMFPIGIYAGKCHRCQIQLKSTITIWFFEFEFQTTGLKILVSGHQFSAIV